jgi:aryl-alcohol dehydrogenase-like predicted oxidoreductase
MKTRKLGYTDLNISTIGLGTWAISGGDWPISIGNQDEKDSIATIHCALDLGINWIDTAAVYGLGVAEKVVGKAVAGRRDRVILTTKCGIVWEDGTWRMSNVLKKESVRHEAEESLRRLRVEVIDLYQIHWPTPDQDLEEGWSTIADLVKEGKVRYAGLSNCSVAQIKRAQAIHPVASLQPEYNLLKRNIEKEILSYCAENQIGVIPYGPMRVGLLSGKWTHEYRNQLDPSDFRLKYDDFRDPIFSANLEFIEKLRPIAARFGRPLSHLAIAWVLCRPEVTATIVGARSPDQIKGTIPAAEWDLSEDALREIDGYLTELERTLDEIGPLPDAFEEPNADRSRLIGRRLGFKLQPPPDSRCCRSFRSQPARHRQP